MAIFFRNHFGEIHAETHDAHDAKAKNFWDANTRNCSKYKTDELLLGLERHDSMRHGDYLAFVEILSAHFINWDAIPPTCWWQVKVYKDTHRIPY